MRDLKLSYDNTPLPRPSPNQHPPFTHKYLISWIQKKGPIKANLIKLVPKPTIYKQMAYQADAEGMAHHLPEKVLCSKNTTF